MTESKSMAATPGQRRRADELVELAVVEFGKLEGGEEKMLRAAAMGIEVYFGNETEIKRYKNAIESGEVIELDGEKSWGENRKIRSVILKWICVIDNAKDLVDPFGLNVVGAKIDGDLDLSGASIPFRLGFVYCLFGDQIWMSSANTQGVNYWGSTLNGLVADGIHVEGDLNFNQGFLSKGEVRLQGATINGDINCVAGFFVASLRRSLNIERSDISGSVFLKNNFHSIGEVCLVGATIGGSLECGAGCFSRLKHKDTELPETSFVLSADRVSIKGNVNLTDNFVSDGELRFAGANISGDLAIENSICRCPNGQPICADRVVIGGSLFMRNGCRLEGEVNLIGAVIHGDLNLHGGVFINTNGKSINLQGAVVHGAFMIPDGVRISGQVNLTSLEIGYFADAMHVWPRQIRLTDFRYRAIYPEAIGSVKDRLAWLKKSDRTCRRDGSTQYVPDPQPYRQLAKVLREHGFEGRGRLIMRACARRREMARFNNKFPVLSFQALCLWHWLRGGRKDQWRWKSFRIGLAWRRWRSAGEWKRRSPQHSEQRRKDRVWAMLRGLGMLLYGMVAGHGYSRGRPLYWVAGFIVVGALVFSDFDPHDFVHANDPNPGGMQQTQGLAIKNAQDTDPKESGWLSDYPAFRPIAYSADAFLPLVNLHQETYWTPKDSWVKSVYLPVHILMGWIVTTLAAVSVTGLVRHERE
ncbi:MAG: hypothetical protein JKX70_02395 [Phycisphaerales bacterium]|nr:hypothetical protein [Phycisphaerales bacterium]